MHMRSVALATAGLVSVLALGVLPGTVYAALININTASPNQLETLSGIGPTKAAAVVEYRSAHGPFASVEAIEEVKGIGPATFTKIKPFITVDAVAPPAPVPSARDAAPAAAPPAQPAVPAAGSHHMQTVEPAVSSSSQYTYAPMDAPAGASAGAASMSPIAGLLHSGWVVGLLSVIAIAGGAVMIL